MASQAYNAAVELVDANIAAGRGAKAAFVDRSGVLTYAGLAEQVGRMTSLVRTYGIAPESRVALLLTDTVDFPVVFLGAMRAGIVPVALNTLLSTEQYAFMLRDCRAKALFASAALLPVVAPLLPQLPDLKHIFVSGGDAPQYAFSLREELSRQSADAPPAETSADEPAFWLYSSGSTGNPKGGRRRSR
jgi:4-hydroxybenzoate-CoA ligase